jgi:hypothetical protein
VAVQGHDYSEAARARAADAGHALPDGSYPVRDCAELADAVRAYGRAPESHRAPLRALIRRRDTELGCGARLERLNDGHDGN